MRLHETGGAIDLKRYRIPLLEEAQSLQDRVVERLAGERPDAVDPLGRVPPVGHRVVAQEVVLPGEDQARLVFLGVFRVGGEPLAHVDAEPR